MFAIKNICISILSILCLITLTLEERVISDHNYIQQTEQVIGVTLNLLFNSLGIKNPREIAKIKQYVSVHDYFVSLTLRDYNDLQDIANLTRVKDTNVSKLIAILNEILSEDSVYNLLGISMGTENNWGVDKENELEKFKFLNKFYKEQYVGRTNFTNEIGNKIDDDSDAEEFFSASNMTTITGNQTKENFTNLSDENEFWHEEHASGRRIYQGLYTNTKTYPFMASIEMFSKFHCGGAIIQSDLVLTAASCLQLAWNNRYYRENPIFVKVRVGSSFFEHGGDLIEASEIYFYPDYIPKILHHNIAVIRLSRNINFKHKQVKKIKVDRETNALPMNIEKITVLGWGLNTKNNVIQKPSDHKLKYSHLQMYMLEECQDIYSEKYVTKEQNFCAGYISKGSGACNRDVGGPGVVAGKLTGIISFGAPVCGTPDAPTVFVKVGYYSDWIEEIMEQDKKTMYLRTTTAYPKQTWPLYTVQVEKKLIPIQRERHVDVSIFKKLLKTMFESKEIEEYIEAKSQSVTLLPTVPIGRERPPERPFDLSLNSNTPARPIIYPIPDHSNELDQQRNSDNSDLDVASISSENDMKEFSIPVLPNNTTELPSNVKRPKGALISPNDQQTTPKDVKLPLDYQDAHNGVNVNKGNQINSSVSPDPDEELIERIKNALESPKRQEVVKNVTQENAELNSTLTSLSPLRNAKNETDDNLENAILTLVYMTSNESDNVARAFDENLHYDFETVQDKISELAPIFDLTFNEKATNQPKTFVFTPLTKNDNITGEPRFTKLLTESPLFEYK